MHTVRVKFAVLFLLAAGGVFAPAFLEAFYRQNAPLPARPFSAAERLVYAIKWDPPWYLFFLPSMGAGDVEIRLDGITEYRNKNAFKIVLHAKSSGALARLTGVQVDNTFTYYTDPATFCTIGAINIVREGNRRRHNETHYFYETGNLSFREINEAV
ncbi:MAG TPA: DUF3108 domain-containing protein, partial [Acidobacteriota bacterium]|nr:DUF3108 domain-containing protein [Acidobacteriota bacterium]